jgi:hypothetical protein
LSSYLDSAVKFAYTLYSALERYAKSRDEIHFRKRRTAQLIKRKSSESAMSGQSLIMGYWELVNPDGSGELDEEAVPLRAVPTYTEHRKEFRDIERVSYSAANVDRHALTLVSNIVSRRRECLQDLDTLSGTIQGVQGSLENEATSRTDASSCREYQKRGLLLQGTLSKPFQTLILQCPCANLIGVGIERLQAALG